MSEFLQLRHHAVRNARDALGAAIMRLSTSQGSRGIVLTFSIKAVHHPTDELQFVLEAKVYEVCVNEDPVGRNKGSVMLQEKRGGDLWPEHMI